VTGSKRFEVLSRADRSDITFDDGGMNLLSSDALAELGEVIRHLSPVTRHLLFRSARPALFAAGADMAEMQRFGAREAEEFSRAGQELFDAIEKLPMLTIAFIDGDCFGGALDLAMAFDVRIATPRSRFSHPGARLGIITGFGGTSRWRSIIAPAVARRLFLGNEIFNAADALQGGLIDRIADEADVQVDARQVRMIKDLARHGGRLSQRELLELARHLERLY
jgi:enoyl-CoA hydratase/carnithine racemase